MLKKKFVILNNLEEHIERIKKHQYKLGYDILKVPKLPDIKPDEYTPLVENLLEVVHYQSDFIQALKSEIAILKGDKKPPTIRPGNLGKGGNGDGKGNANGGKPDGKRPGSAKKDKTENLEIHSTEICPLEKIPEGSVFKGYNEFVVQGLIIKSHNVLYKIERWLTPEGNYVTGTLPSSVIGHFDSSLVSYVQYQYHQCRVTQPLLLEELREFGVDISSGQLNNILINGNEEFHEEKEDILKTGLEVSNSIHADDTGARHDGKNGYCTHIGNKFFTWFSSGDSKSRINFLTLLHGKDIKYSLNEDAIVYFESYKLPAGIIASIIGDAEISFDSTIKWDLFLFNLGIDNDLHIRVATEGALIGGLFEKGFNRNLAIITDDAGQFNVLLHALCWVHAERLIHKLVPFTDEQRTALENVIGKVWNFYRKLLLYKENPGAELKSTLDKEFDSIFLEKTCYSSLNGVLARLYRNKSELLLVLDRPDIALHNNLSETDIREYVTRKKVSGGTRNDAGRKSRDTFASLKKTVRKLGVSFWKFLSDRNSNGGAIPKLGELIRQRASVAC